MGRLSVHKSFVRSQEIGSTGGEPLAKLCHVATSRAPKPNDATNRPVSPIEDQRDPAARGSPTAAIPNTNGGQNRGPAIIPTKNALATSMIIKRTIRLPCP